MTRNPEQVIADYLIHAPELSELPDRDHAEGLARRVVGGLNDAGFGFVVLVEEDQEARPSLPGFDDSPPAPGDDAIGDESREG